MVSDQWHTAFSERQPCFRPLSSQTFWLVKAEKKKQKQKKKTHEWPITVLYFLVKHPCKACQEVGMHESRALELAKPRWNAAIINVINSTCAFPALTSQHVCCEKGLKLFNLMTYKRWHFGKSNGGIWETLNSAQCFSVKCRATESRLPGPCPVSLHFQPS